MKNKAKKWKVMMLLSLVLFVAGLVATVYLNRQVVGQEIDEDAIEKVQCTVSRIETHSIRVNGSKKTFKEYYGTYNGEEYKIGNVIEDYKFQEGRKADVLLYNGKLYANVEGITSTSPLATVYFVFLFGTVGVFAFMLYAMTKHSQAKKEQA